MYLDEFLFLGALLLSLLASVSLPSWPKMYIARTHLDGAVIQTSKGGVRDSSKPRRILLINGLAVLLGLNEILFHRINLPLLYPSFILFFVLRALPNVIELKQCNISRDLFESLNYRYIQHFVETRDMVRAQRARV